MRTVALLLLAFAIASCSSDEDLLIPSFDPKESLLDKAKPLQIEAMTNSEGIYDVTGSRGSFGDSVVLKWNNGKPSIFCGANAAFFILDAGEVDKNIVFEGYWRYAYGRETGRARLTILANDGARELLDGDVPSAITMQCEFGSLNGALDRSCTMRFGRRIKQAAKPFFVLGHRGGARNSDLHPYSENSVEMIRFAERLGCNGVEIDVRLTKDGVPMLYHDELMNTRLVRGDYLVGPFSDYTYGQLRKFCTLVNGEDVPTFVEALEAAYSDTKLSFIWIDIKTPDVTAAIAPIVETFRKRAVQEGRDIAILMGLPTDDIYNSYLALDASSRPRALCELSIDQVHASDAAVWAPRWTLGTQLDLVRQMHSEGRGVFVWTLDVPVFISEFLRDGEFDGILTNYPSVVAYLYYMRK